MASQSEKQTFSIKGLLGIAVLVAVAYVLVQSKSLLTLYTLATVLLSGLLVVVGFDLGIKRQSGSAPEEPVSPVPLPVTTPAPSKPSAKKRRR